MASSLFHTLNISCRDMINRILDLDVTSHNLANMNTAGYKANRTNFQELLEAQYKEGVSIAGTQIMVEQGAIRNSTNPLDWAIQGEGFFQVKLPDGRTAYTREGQWNLDEQSNLVTASGYPLVWDGQIPKGATDIVILLNGAVEATLETGEHTAIGVVQLARFTNPTGLVSNGKNVYLETEASGKAQVGDAGSENLGWITSHAIEQSNVDLSNEMTRLMLIQRAFQISVRAFQQTDTMISQAINLRKV